MTQSPTVDPGQHLLYLPNELLLCVSQYLTANDLLFLAGVCRHLHYLAIEVLLKRYKIELDSATISLHCKDRSIEALPALAIALSSRNTSPARLSCDLTGHFDSLSDMISEARGLTRYLAKVASVKEVALQLMNPPFTKWEEIVQNLLGVVLLKSCTNLSIKSLESCLTWSISLPDPQSRKWPTFLPMRLFAKKKSFPHLRVCNIQALPRFLLPFYEETLNAAAITELSFRCIFNSKDWETLTSRISLPFLSSLSISSSAILPAALQKFLMRHPSIVSLTFRHNMMVPIHPPRLPAGVLPRLRTLKTLSDYIIHYFPSLETFDELSLIEFPLGDKFHGFDRANDALGRLASCSVDITLSLGFGNVPGIETWLKEKEDQVKEQNVEFSLNRVKALTLDTHIRDGFTDIALASIPKWLSLFPVLEHLCITERCFRGNPLSTTLIQAIGKACPGMKTFSLLSSVTSSFHRQKHIFI